jgi:hypothetical protein
MTAITNFDRAECRRLREGLERAVAIVAKGFGVEIRVGDMRFSAENCTIKLEAAVKAATGEVLSKPRTDFDRYCRAFGLEPEHLNAEFSQGGAHYRITGLKPGASKYPVLAVNLRTGKTYKFPVSAVKRGLIVVPKPPEPPTPATRPTGPAFDPANPKAGIF